MRITIRLVGPLTKYYPEQTGGPLVMDCRDHLTIGELLDSLGLAHDYVSLTLINGERQNKKSIIEPGDTVEIFPPVTGG